MLETVEDVELVVLLIVTCEELTDVETDVLVLEAMVDLDVDVDVDVELIVLLVTAGFATVLLKP